MQEKWIIKYYLNEGSYKCGVAAHKEEIVGDRNYIIFYAQSKLRNSQFKFYDIEKK